MFDELGLHSFSQTAVVSDLLGEVDDSLVPACLRAVHIVFGFGLLGELFGLGDVLALGLHWSNNNLAIVRHF